MKVFITGATGFVGTKVTELLVAQGHSVVGLARSERSARKLTAMGATPVRGTLDDLDVIAASAQASDGVINLGFTNDFGHFDEAVAQETAVLHTLADSLRGTEKPLVITSGTLMMTNLGRPATEKDRIQGPGESRSKNEVLMAELAHAGVRSTAVRLAPTVHNETRAGIATLLAGFAAKAGQAGYLGTGSNRWPSVHRDDAAALFVAALLHGQAGQVYNAVAEPGIPMKTIMTTIATTLEIPLVSLTPAEGQTYFGWFYEGVQADNPTDSTWTQTALDWHPHGTALLTDLTTFLQQPDNVTALKQR